MAIVFPQTASQGSQQPSETRKAEEQDASDSQRISDDAVKDLVQLFKLLADETRLRILFFLHQTDELNVLELCKRLRLRQPSVSHHLALLRAAGLLEMRRQGKHNYYRVLPKRFEELTGLLFDAASGQPLRICFEDYELRYAPINRDA